MGTARSPPARSSSAASPAVASASPDRPSPCGDAAQPQNTATVRTSQVLRTGARTRTRSPSGR